MGEIEVADHQLKSIEFEAEQGRVVTVEDSGVLDFENRQKTKEIGV